MDGTDLLMLLDDIALSLEESALINTTDISKLHAHKIYMLTLHAHVVSALTVLVVQEVVSGDGPVLGIAVDDSYLTLPAEVFTNKNGSGVGVTKS